VDLRNPILRNLLRYVIAEDVIEMKQAYAELAKRFGLSKDKAMEVGEFIWKNRNNATFSSIGHEEIPMNIVKESIKLFKTTFYLAFSKNQMIQPLRTIAVGPLKEEILREVEKRSEFAQQVDPTKSLDAEHSSLYDSISKKAYDLINSAYKANNYLKMVENPRILDVPMLPRGAPLYGKSASTRVLLRYLDSLENQ